MSKIYIFRPIWFLLLGFGFPGLFLSVITNNQMHFIASVVCVLIVFCTRPKTNHFKGFLGDQ